MGMVYAAVKALIVKSGCFLAIKQKIGEKEVWDLPGGRVQHGNDPVDELKREVMEEIGMKIHIKRVAGIWYFFRDLDGGQVVCTTFLCEPVSENINLHQNPDEEAYITKFEWIKPEDFLKKRYQVGHESMKKMIKDVFSLAYK